MCVCVCVCVCMFVLAIVCWLVGLLCRMERPSCGSEEAQGLLDVNGELSCETASTLALTGESVLVESVLSEGVRQGQRNLNQVC